MKKTETVTMIDRVKSIAEQEGRYEVAFFHFSSKFFLDILKKELLTALEDSLKSETPVTVLFEGKTNKIIDVI